MSKELKTKISNKIKVNGPMTIESYMECCLYDSEYGYYINSNPIGLSGDFITAPEISQMFGEIIGLWVFDSWKKFNNNNISIIELGPGKGTLMSDILRVTGRFPEFINQIKLYSLETNDNLFEEQKKNIPFKFSRLKDVHQIPDHPSIIIANEFFDALPIRQFISNDFKWNERLVNINEKGDFFLTTKIISNYNALKVKLPLKGRNLEIYEYSAYQKEIFLALCNKIKKNNGIMLIIDYAKTKDGYGDTLQAMSKHKFTSIFNNPGNDDITSYVNFNAFHGICKDLDISYHGPMEMREFLLKLGIRERAQSLIKNNPKLDPSIILGQLHKLIDKEEMGSIFKVIAITNSKILNIEPFGS
jgi:NADH dehydrogenase [ubiquinone] 1 alpha subcomplex assembly factor 7